MGRGKGGARGAGAWWGTRIALLLGVAALLVGSLLAAPTSTAHPATEGAAGLLAWGPDARATYLVTFREEGLPSGTDWSLVVRAAGNATWGPTNATSSASTLLSEPNGTYLYSAWRTGTAGPYDNGSFEVQGAPVTVILTLTAAPPSATAGPNALDATPTFLLGVVALVALCAIVVGAVAVSGRSRRFADPNDLLVPEGRSSAAAADLRGGRELEPTVQPPSGDPLGHML